MFRYIPMITKKRSTVILNSYDVHVLAIGFPPSVPSEITTYVNTKRLLDFAVKSKSIEQII